MAAGVAGSVGGIKSQSPEQWRHILGVLKAQAETLDYNYLSQWAERIGQSQRLIQAFQQAGL